MRLLKTHVLLRLVNSYIVDSPQPANISYLWNFGSLLATCLIIQILTGVFLAMHYQPHVDFAFNSVEHIMRDVNSGWAVRYTHANVASFFFIFVYALYYKFITSFILFYSNHIIINLCKLPFYCYLLFKKIISDTFLSLFGFEDISSLDKLVSKDIDHKFLQWFVGFTDAEGSFLINIKNNCMVNFSFQITLHIDDSAVLYLIKEKLGIGIVSIKGNSCTFSVNSFQLIVDVLLPIFDKYPLITHKQLNYRDWRIAVLLKKNSAASNRKTISITPETFDKIVKIKESMNNNRTDFNGYNISYSSISKYWLLGFVEGDGSFHFTNNRAIFSITQKDRQVLEAISLFLQEIPRSPIFNGLFISPKPNCIISGKNDNTAYQLSITDTDVLFQYIFPLFKDLPFLSRKGVDFKI
jgi:hypothetical protein